MISRNKPAPKVLVVVVLLVGIAWILQRPKPSKMAVAASPEQNASSGAEIQAAANSTAIAIKGPKNDSLSASEMHQLSVVEEILGSANDNDPRIDSELMVLDLSVRQQLRARFRQLPREQLNRRGTLVFLLGRNLTSLDDFDFLAEVMKAPLCLSVSDCDRAPSGLPADEVGEPLQAKTLLAYPQFVARESLKGYLDKKDPNQPEEFRQMAQSLLETLGKRF